MPLHKPNGDQVNCAHHTHTLYEYLNQKNSLQMCPPASHTDATIPTANRLRNFTNKIPVNWRLSQLLRQEAKETEMMRGGGSACSHIHHHHPLSLVYAKQTTATATATAATSVKLLSQVVMFDDADEGASSTTILQCKCTPAYYRELACKFYANSYYKPTRKSV